MIFCYPESATKDNWLHDCLMSMCTTALTNDAPVEDAAWPACILPEYRDSLQSRSGLEERYIAFLLASAKLSPSKRDLARQCMLEQNKIPQVFDGQTPCPLLTQIPSVLRKPTKQLFEYGFKLLTALSIRDEQFRVIYDAIPARVCQFCGIEPFEAPDISREEFDHYLAISKYPFAGANLRNLAPMGHKCNSAHKGAKDILRDQGSDKRRKCADPYGSLTAGVSLLGSDLFGGVEKNLIILPKWEVELSGPSEEVATWNAVFKIEDRWKKSVLDAEYRDWLKQFAEWWSHSRPQPLTITDVISGLELYINSTIQSSFSDRMFLRRATFEMLLAKCRLVEMQDRVFAWLRALLINHRATPTAT